MVGLMVVAYRSDLKESRLLAETKLEELHGRMMRGNDSLAPPEELGRVKRLGKAVGALPVRGNVDHACPLVIVVVADVVDLVVEMLVARRDAGILADRNCRRVVHPHAQRACKG